MDEDLLVNWLNVGDVGHIGASLVWLESDVVDDRSPVAKVC